MDILTLVGLGWEITVKLDYLHITLTAIGEGVKIIKDKQGTSYLSSFVVPPSSPFRFTSFIDKP